MASFTIAVVLVVIIPYVSCGHTITEKSPESILIEHVHTWLKTNLTNFEATLDREHQTMARVIASKLHREQAELQGKVARVVNGGGIWLLIFPNITITRKEMGELSEEKKLIEKCLVPEISALTKIVEQKILGSSTVASFSKGVLKMCSVFVTANVFLHEYQKKFIQTRKNGLDWIKYLNSDRLQGLPKNDLLPMTARAVLEGINYAERNNGTGKGPVLAKFIQDNIVNRTIIFDGIVNRNDYKILHPQNMRGTSVFDIKLDWILCGINTQPSYAIVNCENGRSFIVGSCSEPRKRFQATFSASVGKDEQIPSNAEEGDLRLKYLSAINPSDPIQTHVDLISSYKTTEATDDGQKGGKVGVITNPNPNLDKEISSNKNPNLDGPPIPSSLLLDNTADDQLPAEPHTPQVTPTANANFSPSFPVDVTDKLAELVKMIPRPAQPDVIANGNIHILKRNETFHYEIPATPGTLFTAILTVKLGMEREDSKKYRLIRIQDADGSIELDAIRQEAMYDSKKIFGTPDEKEFWVLKDTPVNPEEFRVAVDDGLFMFMQTIFATEIGPECKNNEVSRYLGQLMLKERPMYCGAAAQAFSKEDCPGDIVQLIIQFSE